MRYINTATSDRGNDVYGVSLLVRESQDEVVMFSMLVEARSNEEATATAKVLLADLCRDSNYTPLCACASPSSEIVVPNDELTITIKN